MPDFNAKRIDEMETMFRGGMRRVRSELGITSFGVEVVELPPDFTRYPLHDHADDGQEELYVALRGGGTLEVDGETVPLERDAVARVGPAAQRRVLAGPEGIRLLVVGGVPGAPYTVKGWTEVGRPDPMAAA